MNDFLDENQAADYLGTSRRALADTRRRGGNFIPYSKVFNSVRYSKTDLDNYLAAARVEPLPMAKNYETQTA